MAKKCLTGTPVNRPKHGKVGSVHLRMSPKSAKSGTKFDMAKRGGKSEHLGKYHPV